MAKFIREFAIAFAPQVADGTFNATLDAITTTLTVTDGLLLGASGEGEADSGIDFEIEREEEPRSTLPGAFTRPIGLFVRRAASISFSVPFCGNRATLSGAPADGEFIPITGVNALLQASGLVGTAWGAGVGHRYIFGALVKASCLLFANGVRYELLDCVVDTLEIELPPNGFAVATFEISVGSIKEAVEGAIPTTLTFGAQATVRQPIVELAGNTWGQVRGWTELTFSVENEVEDTPDSNAPTGLIPERSDRTTSIEAILYADTADEDFEYVQLGADASGALSQITFTIGTPGIAAGLALAFRLIAAQPVATALKPVAINDKAGAEVTLELHHDTANSELELIFL